MTAIDLPFLWINPGRRKPAAYFRRGSICVRIRDAAGNPVLPGDSGFLVAFTATRDKFSSPPTRAASGAPAPGSLAALIVAYKASPEWTSRAPGTQTDYGVWLTRLRDRYGSLAVAAMPRAFIFKLRDAYATDAGKPTPSRANKAVTVLSLLLAWGVNRGWRNDNPARNPGRLEGGDGFATWTAAQFRTFMDCPGIGEPLKRAAALGYYTGQRPSDCRTVTKAARSGGGIEFIPAKTRKTKRDLKMWIPEDPELTRILDAAPRSDAVTILTRADGRPWQRTHLSHEFAKAVRTAGLPAGLAMHGLRKAMSVNLAESGVSDAEVNAIIFHSDPRMARKYREAAGQKTLARAAMSKLTKGQK